MHTFTQNEKKILKVIRDQNIEDINYLGSAIKDVFFPSHQSALYLEPSSKKAFLFYPTGQKHADRRLFARLISLVTFIEYLQKENLIYLQPTGMNHDVLFYENYKHSFLFGGKNDPDVKYAITQQEFLRIDLSPEPVIVDVPNIGTIKAGQIKSDRLFITDAAGKRYLESTNVSSLYDRLYLLLCSRAFPTETLSRFISNGFCSDEEKRNKHSLCLSRASFLVALVALILTSPWFATPYNNNNGYTAIEQHQFDTLKAILAKPAESTSEIPKDSLNNKTTKININNQSDNYRIAKNNLS